MPKDQVVHGMALMANVCTDMVENKRFDNAKARAPALYAGLSPVLL